MKHYIAIYTEGSLKGQKSGYNTKSPSACKNMTKEQFNEYVKTKSPIAFKIEEI